MTQPALFEPDEALWARRRCDVCGGALSVVHTHTYVVQRQAWIKIGATDKPRRRINELSRPAWTKHLLSPRGMDWHEPLHPLVVVNEDIEHAAHSLFMDLHARGEWFWDAPSLRRWIRDLV